MLRFDQGFCPAEVEPALFGRPVIERGFAIPLRLDHQLCGIVGLADLRFQRSQFRLGIKGPEMIGPQLMLIDRQNSVQHGARLVKIALHHMDQCQAILRRQGFDMIGAEPSVKNLLRLLQFNHRLVRTTGIDQKVTIVGIGPCR